MSETAPAAEATQPAEAEPALRVRIKGEPLARLPDDLYIPPDALEIFLDAFEGPLDLLLYLIRRQNLDIREIPILQITRQYMEYIALMQQLKLELAAEYLLMAAWLAEIKSRVLLPRPSNDADEDEEDPRSALLQRLQEYERFKSAAETLDGMPRMGREMHAAQARPTAQPPALARSSASGFVQCTSASPVASAPRTTRIWPFELTFSTVNVPSYSASTRPDATSSFFASAV